MVFCHGTAPTPTRFEYDALGRFTRALLAPGAEVTAAYGAGREAHTDPLGRTTVTTRDARGRKATKK